MIEKNKNIEIEVFEYKGMGFIIILEITVFFSLLLTGLFGESLAWVILAFICFYGFGSLRSYFQTLTVGKIKISDTIIEIDIKGIYNENINSNRIDFFLKKDVFELKYLGEIGGKLRYFNLYNKARSNDWDRIVINDSETYNLKICSVLEFKNIVNTLQNIEKKFANIKVHFEL